MAHYENAELGLSFDLPDNPTALTVLTYDSKRIETNGPAIIVLWECILPLLDNWQCEIFPNPRTPLDQLSGENAVKAASIVKLDARRAVQDRVALQGNLDPSVLYARPEQIRAEVARVLASFGRGHGHVFNLGHGIHPDVPPEHALAMVEAVHDLKPRVPRGIAGSDW